MQCVWLPPSPQASLCSILDYKEGRWVRPTNVTILSNLTLIQLSDTPRHRTNIFTWSLTNTLFLMATVSLLRRIAALVAMGMISYAGAKAPIQRHRTPIADFVFQNGSIYTLDAGSAKVSSLAIKNGVIISLGDDAKVAPLIGSNTQVLDLGGRMAMPGFVDPHMHAFQAGQDLLKCNFNYQRLNVEQVLAHLQTCLDSDPERTDDDWLDGVALNYMSLALAGETLTKDDLDSLNTNRPIFVRSNDYHTFVLNSRALVLSNITATTPNPQAGLSSTSRGPKSRLECF